MQVEDTRMYRVKDVAAYFNVSASTIYRAIESGQLDALRLGTAVRVPGTAVLAYAETCWQSTDPPTRTVGSIPHGRQPSSIDDDPRPVWSQHASIGEGR